MLLNESDDHQPKRHNSWKRQSRSQQSPPDLEAILKKFTQEVKTLFNVKNKPAGSNNSGKITPIHLALIGGFMIALWFLSGLLIVAPAEKAVVLLFGKYNTTLGPGPHWIARFIESPYIINEQKISNYSYESQMLTKDENIVSVALAIQYRITDARAYLFNVVNPNGSLQQATASALRQVIGRSTLDEVLTRGRERIRQEIKISLKNILDRYKTGLLITDVVMQPTRAPDEVKEAFDDATKAQEDEQRFINQSQAYAMQVIPTAKGESQRIAADARAYKEQVILNAKGDVATFLPLLAAYQKSPVVTRERLYLEAIESVLTATNKILVTTGSNNLFYLPLDKWFPQTNVNKQLPFMLDTKATPLKNNNDQPKETVDRATSDERTGY